jgi:putative tricarboxylic transport membrane protein
LEILHNLFYGFSVSFQPENLVYCFIGAVLGTLIGVLPGIGPVGAISLLLPATFHLPPIPGTIMLAGIFYGSAYGGSTTSILVNIPGEAASIVTCLDGYQMAKKGRAGPALGIAAFGSFIAGTLGLVGLFLFAAPLAQFALRFGAPEYCALVLMGLVVVTYLSTGPMIKTIMVAAFGLILSSIGLDAVEGTPKLTFDILELSDGLGLVPISMGMFGISEVLVSLETDEKTEILKAKTSMRSLFPSVTDWIRSTGAIIRGSILGFFVGLMPGGNPVTASFLSYGIEKKASKYPYEFGKGAIEGVAGPEAANNSATAGSFIPLFTLGIPCNLVMALMFGALMIHGMQPGPFLLKDHPDLFWGVICSMYVGNVMLLVLNLPLIPLWVQVLKVPRKILFPLIMMFCIIGAYSLNNSAFDIIIMMIAGFVGYLFRKFEYEGAALMLAFVLGPMFEKTLRQSLILSRGSFTIFVTRPISAVLVGITVLVLAGSLLSFFRKGRKGIGISTPVGKVEEKMA